MQEDQAKLLAFIQRCGGTVTVRDVVAGCRHIRTADEAEAVLTRLVSDGSGSWVAKPSGPQGGRPSEVFVVSKAAPKVVQVIKTKPRRKGISKRVRFEVFKRDNWSCQYCGSQSPNVKLHVDHITPVSKGGTNDLENLTTSCIDCNLGKGARELDDDSAVRARSAELEANELARQQLAAMRDWHVTKASLSHEAVDMLCEVWHSYTSLDWHLASDEARDLLHHLLRKFSFDEVADGMHLAYQKLGPTSQAFFLLKKFCGIAKMNRMNPDDAQKRYVLGILKNRLSPHVNLGTAAGLIDEAVCEGVDYERLKDMAKAAVCWSQFRSWVLYDCCEQEADHGEN